MICGHEWSTTPTHLLSGTSCPRCARNLRHTHEEFMAAVADINPNVEILGEYAGTDSKVPVRCKACGHEWSPRAGSLLAGQGCPSCANVLKKSHEQFVEEVMLANPTIEPLQEYDGANNRILFHCKVCDGTWMATPHAVLSGGTGCPDCAGVGTSFFEQALRFTLSDIVGEDGVMSRDRKTLGTELDVYVPSLGLAYEPGAWYYHAQRISVDEDKARLCAAKGIKLTTIYTGYPSGEKPPFEGNCITSEANLGISDWEEAKEVIEQLLREAKLDRDSVDWESVRLRAVAHSGRRTAVQFVETLREINPSIEVVGDYQSMRTKIAVRCRVCGHEWNAVPFNLVRGHGCRACANAKLAEDRRKPLALLVEELAIANPNIELIGEYTNTDTKTRARCLVCEYTWDAYPSNLLKGEGCPNCQGNRKKTHEEFAAELAVKNPRVMLIGTYTSNREKVLVGCVDCEHKWMASPPDLLRGRACPKCGRERAAAGRRKTHEAFVSQLAKVNPTIEPIDRYAGARTRIRFRCLVCGNEWMATPDNVLRGRGCPPCRKGWRRKKA